MRVRKLINNDSTFGNGQLDFYKDNVEGIAQNVLTRLRLWVNEWFLNVEEGTPWLEGILGKSDEFTRDSIIRTRILNTEGVTELVSYESIVEPNSRTLSVSFVIDTIYGQSTIIQVTL